MTPHLHIGAEPGLWRQQFDPAPDRPPRPALFLDRDGVLLEEIDYLHKVADMRIIPGAADTVRAANEASVPVIVVTNQSGVGRGYYDWPDFAAVQAALVAQFAAEGASFDMVLACAYHREANPPYDRPDHPWRKPQPGMLHEAAQALRLDLARSWIVGDSASDIEAGRDAGLAGALHVETGHGPRDRDKALALSADGYAVRPVASIADAVELEFIRHDSDAP